MQRLVEQPTGNGEIFDGDAPLGRVHYHLAVYRHFADVETDSVPANVEVEGRLTPIDRVDLGALHRRAAEVTVHLSDGRAVDLSILDEHGRIRSTGRGLFQL